MLPISVCMIAKNEEKHIGECLRRLSSFDWEIIVADTGSTDHTVEIARIYTPHIYHFHWVNDFSAARNYAVSKASNDYILMIDCDEYLMEDALTAPLIFRLPQLIAPEQAGLLHLLNPLPGREEEPLPPASLDVSSSIAIPPEHMPVTHEHVARFFHRKYTYYQGTIHEQLTSKDGKALQLVPIPLSLYHVGYSSGEIRKKKASRNIPMLEKELKANGPEPYLLFQLAQSYFGLCDYESALPYFEQILSMDIDEQEEYVQTMIESYGYCLLHLKQYQKALELEGIYPIFSKRADFVFLMGLVYMNNAMFDRSIAEFLKAASIPAYAMDGVNSYLAYYNIGVIYECMGDYAKASAYYKKCGDYEPALEREKELP